MSNKEIKDLPADKAEDEIDADDLGNMSGGVMSGGGIGSVGSIGGISSDGVKVNRTQIEFTGDEVDSQ